MTRVDELQKRYPSIPREVIVKLEVLGKGIQDNDDLDKASVWIRGGQSYITYDFDVTQKEVEEKRQGRSKPGFISIPDRLRMANGLGVALRRHSKSPYELRDLARANSPFTKEMKRSRTCILFVTVNGETIS